MMLPPNHLGLFLVRLTFRVLKLNAEEEEDEDELTISAHMH